MGKVLRKLKKISSMDPGLLARKLLSFEDVYATGYRKIGDDAILPIKGVGSFDVVPLDKDFWYADPVLYKHNGRSYLFTEAFDKKNLIGRIAVSELTVAGATKPQLIICEPFHMSFPMVFDWRGEVYMIPETSAKKSFRLYKAVSFPDKWELAKEFEIGREFVDTVIVRSDENSFEIISCEVSPYKEYECRFQKFTVKAADNGELSIIEDKEFNQKQNFDLKSRNGGAIVEHAGKRYVAAQESKMTAYGLYMNFFEYTDDKERIADKPAYRITAKDVSVKGVKSGDGVHSYCNDGEYEVIDLKYMEFTPQKLLRRILRSNKNGH